MYELICCFAILYIFHLPTHTQAIEAAKPDPGLAELPRNANSSEGPPNNALAKATYFLCCCKCTSFKDVELDSS